MKPKKTLEPLHRFPPEEAEKIRYVLADLDDTLTLEGRILSASFSAMERLEEAGIRVVAVTGRPAGWCDHMARMWPLAGVVGENGAFYFHYDRSAKKMLRRFWMTPAQREEGRRKLETLKERILREVPGAAVSADQEFRISDLAIDFCEDVPPLPREEVLRIREIFLSAGARAKISSIHVNGWFGDFDKLSMTRVFFREVFRIDLEREGREKALFVGDSPNDAPMFGFFPNAVGVANVRDFEGLLEEEPAWVTPSRGGLGFRELADFLLSFRHRETRREGEGKKEGGHTGDRQPFPGVPD